MCIIRETLFHSLSGWGIRTCKLTLTSNIRLATSSIQDDSYDSLSRFQWSSWVKHLQAAAVSTLRDKYLNSYMPTGGYVLPTIRQTGEPIEHFMGIVAAASGVLSKIKNYKNSYGLIESKFPPTRMPVHHLNVRWFSQSRAAWNYVKLYMTMTYIACQHKHSHACFTTPGRKIRTIFHSILLYKTSTSSQ